MSDFGECLAMSLAMFEQLQEVAGDIAKAKSDFAGDVETVL